MRRGSLLALATTVAVAGGACRRAVDVAALTRTRGLDGAAQALRDRLATDPREPDLLIALAEVEAARQRPGAALAALDRAEQLGRPFRGGLDAAARARLAALLIDRALARVERGSPDAEVDLVRARTLGAAVDPRLGQRAALLAIAGDLRHSDPERRARGQDRLRAVDPDRAAGLDAAAPPAAIERTTAWLVAAGARRVAFEALDRVAERAAAAGAAPAWPAATVERWLTLRRWWSGEADPIDRLTLDHARTLGASTCAYASGPADPGCDVIAAAASPDPGGATWEPLLVIAWQRGGWVAPDRARAEAWAIVAARAVARGQLASWQRAVRDHVAAGPALDPAPALPAVGVPSSWPAQVAAVGAEPTLAAGLARVAVGFARDPALADRRAEDLAARAIDVAIAGPALGRVFALLGDPARARAWWQRGFDASAEDPALALGLALALAAAGDGPAGLQLAMRAAAGSGDAAATLVRAARGFAAAGLTLDALALARQAIELSAPGDEDPAAGLAAMLLRALGRDRAAAEVGALATLPSAWDLTDLRAELDRVAAAPRPEALGRLLDLARSVDPATAHAAAIALRTFARDSAAAGAPVALP